MVLFFCPPLISTTPLLQRTACLASLFRSVEGAGEGRALCSSWTAHQDGHLCSTTTCHETKKSAQICHDGDILLSASILASPLLGASIHLSGLPTVSISCLASLLLQFYSKEEGSQITKNDPIFSTLNIYLCILLPHNFVPHVTVLQSREGTDPTGLTQSEIIHEAFHEFSEHRKINEVMSSNYVYRPD